MDLIRRHPVAVGVIVCVGLATVLIPVAFALPLQGNVEHAVGHLSLAVPILLLLVWALLLWPATGPEVAARLARGTVLLGLAIAGLGLVTEAIGAFGYPADQTSEANGLTVFHGVGVTMWPVGFVALMAGTILSSGVWLARRRGVAGSRIVTAAAAVALVAMVAFVAGALIFGY